jgi:arsenite/tail-anchored protein-transporting ATPase
MRIILYTGKGGVGKTSIAAATAVKSAEQGNRTLIVSTDPAHSLGDSLDRKLIPEPMEIRPNLWAQEIDTIHEMEQGWGKVQQYITALLTSKAVQDITTEELTMFPGMEDLLSLLKILQVYKEGTYDTVIVDCAPTGETLALLSFPDMMRWWLERIFPVQKAALKVVRPVVGPLLGIPMPSNSVINEIENLYHQLDEMRTIIADRETTSIRIVVNPEKMVVKEAQRSFTYLNIYDFNVDAIIVNRVIPDQVTDVYFSAWKEIQQRYKEMITESFSPVPILYAPLYEQELVGFEMLTRTGDDLFKSTDPTKVMYNFRTQQVRKEDDQYVLSIYMPFTDKNDLSLNQKFDELIIRAGSTKRTITLPRTIQGLSIVGAKFEEDTLNIRFGG